MSDQALRALSAANPTTRSPLQGDDEALLRSILETPRAAPRRRRRGIMLAIASCLLIIGASAAYAALGGMDAASVDANLKQSAKDARPLTTAQVDAMRRSNAADEALYRCFKAHGTPTDGSGGLTPTRAVKATCAPQIATDNILHRDPAVRAGFAAEALLIGAAWYCVQQQGYEVNGNRITKQPPPAELAAIWQAFAKCEAQVGVPEQDRATGP